MCRTAPVYELELARLDELDELVKLEGLAGLVGLEELRVVDCKFENQTIVCEYEVVRTCLYLYAGAGIDNSS